MRLARLLGIIFRFHAFVHSVLGNTMQRIYLHHCDDSTTIGCAAVIFFFNLFTRSIQF